MTRSILSFIFLFVASSLMQAQEFLEPEDGAVTDSYRMDYQLNVRKILLTGLSTQPVFRMVCLPSFSSEWVVDIEPDESRGLSVITVTSEQQIWYSVHMRGDNRPLKAEDVRTDMKKATIDSQTAHRVHDIIQMILAEVQYPKTATLGLDGSTYHFSSWRELLGCRYGKTWSPEKGSRAYKLVALGEQLRKYALEGGTTVALNELLKQIESFSN